ncbi:MAG: hypothetical protein R8G66_20445 [Cytophagales bacterium]|nr:hypothetical protein [Cytophagales bacterium]
MSGVYQKLISVTVKSEYFGESTESFVNVQPTSEWIDLFHKYQVIFKATSNGLFVSTTSVGRERLNSLSTERPYLTFELTSNYPGIKNVVDVRQYTNKSTPYLVSSTGTDQFDQQYLLPMRRSLGAYYASPEVTITRENPPSKEPLDILHDTTLRSTDRAFPMLLAEMPDGKYNVRGVDLYLSKQGLKPGHCAVIAVSLAEVLAATEVVRKELVVPTREVYLKYWINSGHHDLNTLSVKDQEGKISFESRGIGPYGMLFQSSSRLKLMQQSPYQIRLVNGKKKPLIDKLPLGNATAMKPMEQQPDEYFNEVFINV